MKPLYLVAYEPDSLVDQVLTGGLCVVGCGRPKHAGGMCRAHAARWRRAWEIRLHLLPECSMKDCHDPIYNRKRQLCKAHYDRYLTYGDPAISRRLSREDRFWAKVDKNGPIPAHRPHLGPCWIWTASKNKGYGQFIEMRGKRGYPSPAHRVAWELLIAPIPAGLVIDHLCRNRACVNPAHMEPVTNEENIRRGEWRGIQGPQPYCDRGHEFTPENTYWRPDGKGRQCRECARIRQASRSLAQRAA